MKKLKIAFIGLKGIPAQWGGIEVYVQEIAKQLVQRGHEVTVYSRRWFAGTSNEFAGIRILTTPTIKKRSTDALLHGFTSSIHAATSDFDIVHYHGIASYFSSLFPRIAGKKVVVTVHADSWVEPKWNALAVLMLKMAINAGIKTAHRITTISPILQDMLGSITRREVTVTPPGVVVGTHRQPVNISKDFGLEANSYILFMGRLDTVKRVHVLVEAFKALQNPTMKLVITGDAGPSDGIEYKKQLMKAAISDKRIVFTGFQSGIVKEELLSNSFLFVLPSLNEGVPIALLEGMSYGRPCLASDIPAHRRIISDGTNGFLADADSLENFKQKFLSIVSADRRALSAIGANARAFVRSRFNWYSISSRLEEIYYSLLS